MVSFLRKLFGTRNDRILRQYQRIVNQINALEPEMQALDDQSLQAKTDEFRERLQSGATLDELMPEAFAVVREAGVRVFEMRHLDRKSTRLNSSHVAISYGVVCLIKKNV